LETLALRAKRPSGKVGLPLPSILRARGTRARAGSEPQSPAHSAPGLLDTLRIEAQLPEHAPL